MSERRFTDREVARILERAAELDRRAPDRPETSGHRPTLARGLTVSQLQEIGVEAGIPPELIAKAAAELSRPATIPLSALLGAPPVARETRAVRGRLTRDELAALVRVVDERVPAQGTVTEALGAVRWAAGGRFLDRKVTLEPQAEETRIQVEERFATRVPGLLQGLPAAYGAMFGLVTGLEWIGGGLGAGLLGALVLGLTAWLLGRLVWGAVAGRSDGRIGALADELAEVAERIASAEEPERYLK